MNDEDPTQRVSDTPRQQTAASERQADARDGTFQLYSLQLCSLPSEIVLWIFELIRDKRDLRALAGCSRSLKHALHSRCWSRRLKVANVDQIREACEVMNFHLKTAQGPRGIPSPIADTTTLAIEWDQDPSSCSLGSEHFAFLSDLERSVIWEKRSEEALRQLRCLQRDCLLRAFTVVVVEQMPKLDSLSFVPHCDEGREQDRVWSDWIEETIVARRSRETSRKRIRASSDESDTSYDGFSTEGVALPPRISNGLKRLRIVGIDATSIFKRRRASICSMRAFPSISRIFNLGSFDRLECLTIESESMSDMLRSVLVRCRWTLKQLHLYTMDVSMPASFDEYQTFFADLLDVKMWALELLRVDICEFIYGDDGDDVETDDEWEEMERSGLLDFAKGPRHIDNFVGYDGFCPETIVDFARNHPRLTEVNFNLFFGESHIIFKDENVSLFTWH